MKLKKRVDYFTASSFALLALLAFIATNPVVKTNSFAADDPVLGDTELTISTSSLDMIASNISSGGTFIASDSANIEVATTNYTGYKLTIAANDPTSSDAGKLMNGSYAIDSISNPTAAEDFTNNVWGLLPSMVDSSANSLYQPAPTSEEMLINETAAANTTADVYTLAFGTKVDYSVPAGKYSNTFIITATPNPVMYGISFVSSIEPGITNMPETEYGSSLLNGATITDQIPERDGYDFCAWCSGEVTTAVGVDSCDSDSYLPGDSIDLLALPSPFITLKTMWTPSTYTISYDLDGGTAIDNPVEYTVLTEGITLNKPTKSGFKFMGWTGTGLTEPTKVVTIPAGSTGNRSYTATWAVQTCEFTSETITYSGSVYPWTVPDGCSGNYQLDVYGAQGGGLNTTPLTTAYAWGGKGGHASGTVTLAEGDTLFVVVGGAGSSSAAWGTSPSPGGYNGGGAGYGGGSGTLWAGFGGGGATHIAKVTGQLKEIGYDSFVTEGNGLIVAGGGSGARYDKGTPVKYSYMGGSGGGESGGQSVRGSGNYINGTPGTQTSGYAFGLGQDGSYHSGGFTGGGGGGFYGGGMNGGGSGWIGGVENGVMENGVQTDDGQAIITLLDD